MFIVKCIFTDQIIFMVHIPFNKLLKYAQPGKSLPIFICLADPMRAGPVLSVAILPDCHVSCYIVISNI